jgi:uncharacterized membrane protein
MRRFLRDQSLTIAMLGIFAVLLLAQSVTGMREYNQDQRDHGEATVSYGAYLQTGHFVEATFENWESEFLQMGMYVLATAFLFQRGSAESKDPEGDAEAVDEDPREARDRPGVPWPVRRGGVVLALYNNSLTAALLLIFAISFVLHAWGGAHEYSEEQLAHGGETVSMLAFMGTSAFWFQSFQNWQSEFLAVGMLSVLSIWLRQKGSPESKPVAAPHRETGSS